MLHILDSFRINQKTQKNTQFTVYVYHERTHAKRLPSWEKIMVSDCIHRATLHARDLQKQNVFERIEVQKNVFSGTGACLESKTIKTYGAQRKFAKIA